MMTFATRRWITIGIAGGIAVLLVFAYIVSTVALLRTNVYSGWTLLLIIFGLTLFNTRKKLAPLQLGSSAVWLQFHVYVGLLSCLVFVLHAGFEMPTGGLEITLAILYVLAVGTGCVGFALSRLLPTRLRKRGDEVLFEQIPRFRQQLCKQVEELVVRAASEGRTRTIPDFYTRRLARFFSGPRHLLPHLVGYGTARHTLLAELVALHRYMSESERVTSHELAMLIEKKDDLDYQYAVQATLKYWLFVHIPLTYSLLIFSLLHVIVVYAFSGGIG